MRRIGGWARRARLRCGPRPHRRRRRWSAAREERLMTIYERLGVRPVVNAAGTLTRLGGTMMCEEAVEAMQEVAPSAVGIDELQEAASRLIARHTGAEAGMVTSGAFGALGLAAGAGIAGPGGCPRN